jgi:dolichol-phosphate mannosyltransferase
VIRRVGERGLSTAVIRGWQAARGDVLAVIDADLQHPPEVVVELFRKVRAGADLAVGSRNAEGGGVSNWSVLRRALSRGAQLLGLMILPGVLGRVSDPMSGYFMLRRKVIGGVTLSPLGYKILIEVIGRGKVVNVAEVGYVFRERLEGESKVTWHLYIEYLRHLVRLRLASLPIARFMRFAFVGLSGVGVDMGLLYLLSDPSSLGWGLTRSKIIAAEAAILNNFLWNDLWTFRDLAKRQPGMGHRLRRLVKFNIVCGIGLALNVILLNVMFNWFHLNRYVANAIAIGVVTAWNFWINMKLSWRDTSVS